jgi:hypothetical protein
VSRCSPIAQFLSHGGLGHGHQRAAPHGITGTVEMAFCGEPSISLSLIAK